MTVRRRSAAAAALVLAALAALAACSKCGSGDGAFNAPSDVAPPAAKSGPVAAMAPVQGAQPVYREIKDWLLACDNTRTCFGKFVSDEDASPGGYLSVTREGGPAGVLTVHIEAEDEDAVVDPTRLRLDGKPLPAGDRWKAQDGGFSLQGPAAVRFVRAIRDGSVLALSDKADGPAVSLNGLAAVLLAMDETQGRLGNETALIRTGAGPASAVPAAPALPVVRRGPVGKPLANAAAFAAAVRRTHAAALEAHGCEPEQGGADGDSAYPLGDGEALVTLKCMMGAYQGAWLTFRAPRDAPEKAVVLVMPTQPTLNPEGNDGQYVEGEYDPATATFTEAGKGRGLGDCGTVTDWTFDGRAFVLTRFDRQERCGGPPGDWPTLYRTRVE